MFVIRNPTVQVLDVKLDAPICPERPQRTLSDQMLDAGLTPTEILRRLFNSQEALLYPLRPAALFFKFVRY
jgi:hypothetical protein